MTTLPDPIPGLVIRYAYLWRDEALRRREEGTKYRSAMVVLVATEDGGYGTTHHCYRKRVANKEYPMVGADFGKIAGTSTARGSDRVLRFSVQY